MLLARAILFSATCALVFLPLFVLFRISAASVCTAYPAGDTNTDLLGGRPLWFRHHSKQRDEINGNGEGADAREASEP